MAVDVTDCFAPGLYGISLVIWKRIWGGQLFLDLKGQHFQLYMWNMQHLRRVTRISRSDCSRL